MGEKIKMKRTFFLIAKIMASPTLITGERDQNIMNLNLTMRTIDEAGLPPLDVLLTEDDKFDEIENETLSLNRTDKNDTNVTNNVTEMVDESGLPPTEVLLEVTETKTVEDNDEFAGINDNKKSTHLYFYLKKLLQLRKSTIVVKTLSREF